MPPKSSRPTDILTAARQSFTTIGYDGTTVGAIAKELGISKAAVSYYFPAKTDFLTALLDPLVTDLTIVLDRNEPNNIWPEDARKIVSDYLRILIGSHDLACWVDTDLALRLDDRPGTKIRALDLRLARRLTRPSKRRGDHMRALTVVGGIWRPLHHETPAQISQHLDEIVDAALISYAPLDSTTNA